LLQSEIFLQQNREIRASIV